MTDPNALFEIGEIVGGLYEIRSVLGEGGMGRVYAAQDIALNRKVAIKASWPNFDRALLLKEAQALASVRHIGMVDVYVASEHRGIAFFAMEHLYGVTLASLLEKRRGDSSSLGVTEVLDVLIPIADALAAVHRVGLAHRDVKPANMMLTPTGRVVLMDFGLFTAESTAKPLHSGTFEYMSPESLLDQVDPRTAFLGDVYSLGITAYELLAGEPPLVGSNPMETVAKQLQPIAPDLRQARPDVPPAISALVREMLAKDPLERPPSMDAVVFRLRAAREALNRSIAIDAMFRVLVVDDDQAIGKLLGLSAKKTLPNAEVMVVRDAEKALTAVREKAPQIMLLDLHMPGTSGVELCMMLRGMHLADGCTIVAVSAGAQEPDLDLLRQLGITRFVAKGAQLAARLAPHLNEVHEQWLGSTRASASVSEPFNPPTGARMRAARELAEARGVDARHDEDEGESPSGGT